MRRALLFSAITLLAVLPAAAHPRVCFAPRPVVYRHPGHVFLVSPRPVIVGDWACPPVAPYRHLRPRVVVTIGGCLR